MPATSRARTSSTTARSAVTTGPSGSSCTAPAGRSRSAPPSAYARSMRSLPKALWIAVAAVAYSGLLVVLAATVPVYDTSGSDDVEGSATLIDENGAAIALVPLVAAVGMLVLLRVACG